MEVYLVLDNSNYECEIVFVGNSREVAEAFVCSYKNYADCYIEEYIVETSVSGDILAKKVKCRQSKNIYYEKFVSVDYELPCKKLHPHISTPTIIETYFPLDWTTEQCEEWLLDQEIKEILTNVQS